MEGVSGALFRGGWIPSNENWGCCCCFLQTRAAGAAAIVPIWECSSLEWTVCNQSHTQDCFACLRFLLHLLCVINLRGLKKEMNEEWALIFISPNSVISLYTFKCIYKDRQMPNQANIPIPILCFVKDRMHINTISYNHSLLRKSSFTSPWGWTRASLLLSLDWETRLLHACQRTSGTGNTPDWCCLERKDLNKNLQEVPDCRSCTCHIKKHIHQSNISWGL